MADKKIIAFDGDVFDAFMIDVAHQKMLTPRMGGMLNRLMESQVVMEPIAWMKDSEIDFGEAEPTETALYRATWLKD